MNDNMKEGSAVSRIMRISLALMVFFVLTLGADAAIQDLIDAAAPGDVVKVDPGTYNEGIEVNQPIILLGVDNPVLGNPVPGGDIINITASGAIVAGFTITGAEGAGILINDTLEDVAAAQAVYNNIYTNDVGLANKVVDETADAARCFWGDNGTGPQKGRPGWDGNNRVTGRVDYSPWLTAKVTSVNITTYIQQQNCDDPILNNTDAGIDVALVGGVGSQYVVGSAEYLEEPYAPNLPGDAIRYIDIFSSGYVGGNAIVDISYAGADTTGILEDTIAPYVLTPLNGWRKASSVSVDTLAQVVHGSFPVGLLTGSVIALVGQSYRVTIDPPADPNTPIQEKPVFSTFTIESSDAITGVFYQIDSTSDGGWVPIQEPYDDTIWYGAGWTVSDEEWANLTNGTHAFYFNFTRETLPAVGGDGEIKWQFLKGGDTPPPSPIKVISPKAGDKLSRTPWKIQWTLPSQAGLESIDLWFARDGNFEYGGGLNNPIHIITLGGGTSYAWRSPNIQTSTAKILVIAKYLDGTEYYGLSDDFSIVKGYSFRAHKPVPKSVYQPGSGILEGIASIKSWFRIPRFSIQIG